MAQRTFVQNRFLAVDSNGQELYLPGGSDPDLYLQNPDILSSDPEALDKLAGEPASDKFGNPVPVGKFVRARVTIERLDKDCD